MAQAALISSAICPLHCLAFTSQFLLLPITCIQNVFKGHNTEPYVDESQSIGARIEKSIMRIREKDKNKQKKAAQI